MILSLPHIIAWLLLYKYLVLFPLIVFEGPLVTMITGWLTSLGYFNFVLAYCVIVVGDVSGDSLYYLLGRWGRGKFMHRWGKFVGLTPQRVEYLETHFSKHSAKTLLIGKLTHAVGAPILVAAGLANVPYGEFLWFNFLATLPKSLVLLVVGFYFGQAYVVLSRYLNYVVVAGLLFIILVLLSYLLAKKFRPKLENS